MRVEVLWLAGGWGVRLGVGWIAGSVLWGSGCAAQAGGSGRCPRGCPPWGPVVWSRVLWGSLPLALGAASAPPSSSGACLVALAVARVVAWRWGSGGGLCGGVLSGSFCGCNPFSPCGCVPLPLCGFRWPVGVSLCGPYGVPSVLRQRVLADVRLRGSRGVV